MYICLSDLKIHVPALVQGVAGGVLPADLVVLQTSRLAESIADLDNGGAVMRLSQYREIVNKYALVYKHDLDGWCCTCPTFLRDALCAHDRVWRAFLRLADLPRAVAQLAGGVRGRPAAGTARAQAGADSRAARARRTDTAHDAPAAAAAAAAAAAPAAVEVEADADADLEAV